MEETYKLVAQPQRRLNPAMKEVARKEVVKLLEAWMIYPISDNSWVSPIQVDPKKRRDNSHKKWKNELIPSRTVTGWRMCIDYRKLNQAIRKDHFPLPFMDQMLERLARQAYYCFLDGYSDYNQIAIDPKDQEKTSSTCPFRIFAYRRMPLWIAQCSIYILKMYDGNFLRYRREKHQNFHGQLFSLWSLIWKMIGEFGTSPSKV